MQAVLSLDLDQAEAVGSALAPSLRDSDAVRYDIAVQDRLEIVIDADGLGPLRGATNTALMLTKLSDNVMTDED